MAWVKYWNLQEQQRIFVATLATGRGVLPDMVPGSRVRVIGVCDDEAAAITGYGEKPPGAQFLASLNILLRSPQDVTVLRGPPWWTWRKLAIAVGMLLTVLLVTLLWVHLLQRRLERQQAAQLAFSRQVLERLEDERHRIAANLHDSLGQTLLVIKNRADLAIQRPSEEQGLRNRLDEISGEYIPSHRGSAADHARLAALPVGSHGPDPGDTRVRRQASENSSISICLPGRRY